MITHDYQLIFVHVPKCAGRSICDLFNQRFDHYTARYYEDEYSQYWNKYRKITIVRNPYDRLVALYLYIKHHRRHINEPIACNISSFKLWLETNMSGFKGNFTMTAEGQRGTDGQIGSPFWFTSQWQRIIDKNGLIKQYDLVHKLDNITGMHWMDQYLSEIIQKPISTPHVNGNAESYNDYREFYDNETYAMASLFPPIIEDCEKLGYQF